LLLTLVRKDPQESKSLLPLPLFVARISANNENNASASNNLAFLTDAANAGANLHTQVRGWDRPRLQQNKGRGTGVNG